MSKIVRTELGEILTEYADVLEKPHALPLDRPTNHRINLLLGSQPVNVRPYRYPHYLKSEIEKLTKEMLHQGLIQPSISPYSSPVLLVKKHDGEWRFCVDYHTLNAITIRDLFPIPTMDELLDELQAAMIFSKLDL